MNYSKTEQFRNTNLDLVKVFLMFFIIMHHLFLRICGLRELTTESYSYNISPLFINSFFVVAVNIYFLISGYFGIKKNTLKLTKIIMSVYFFYWLINILGITLGKQKIDTEFIKGLVFPISQYWFVLVYIILSLIAPFLNLALEHLDLEKQKKFILALLFIWCGYAFLIDNEVLGANRGYSLGFAMILYLIGDYLRKRNFLISSKCLFGLYLLSSSINGILVVFSVVLVHNQKLAWQLYSYNNPFVLFGSICLFLAFNYNLTRPFISISKLSRYSLYIYVVHSTPIFADFYIEMFRKINYKNMIIQYILIFLFAGLLFAIGLVLGKLYNFIWNLLKR